VNGEPLIRWDWVGDHIGPIGDRVGQHLQLAAIAILVGFAVSFALATISIRQRRLYPVIATASTVAYTIPSFALFAALVAITGPRTAEGKARVAQNAVRHGLTAKHLVIRPEDEADFAALRDDLLAELAPEGATEILTFNELLHAAWSLQRFRRIESEACLGTLDDFTDPQTTAVLDRLSRYQARAQRAFYKSLAELRILQTNRALRQAKLAPETAVNVPAITDINNLTKQTHSEVQAAAIDQAVKLLNYETGVLMFNAQRKSDAKPAVKPRPNVDDRALRL
jgi:ABC-type proline/glycine betaine transport system permease subunit